MKYLIEDTEDCTLGEINKYFRDELKKTNRVKAEIVIDKKLQRKIGIMEIGRIFTENGFTDFTMDFTGMYLNLTGNAIEFSDDEIFSRFDDVFNSEIL